MLQVCNVLERNNITTVQPSMNFLLKLIKLMKKLEKKSFMAKNYRHFSFAVKHKSTALLTREGERKLISHPGHSFLP